MEGADMTTFLAPAWMWAMAFSLVRNLPVDSRIYSAPTLPQGISPGFSQLKTMVFFPLTVMEFSSQVMSASHLPCTVSYFSI